MAKTQGVAPMPSRDEQTPALPPADWNLQSLARHRSAAALGLFGLAYTALVYLGYGLRSEHGMLVIIWPAAGLLLMALFLTRPRDWPWLIALQLCIEVLVDWVRAPQFQAGWSILFAAADSVDGIVGATLARRWVRHAALPRIRQVLAFFGASGLGAAASAALGALGAVNALTDVNYLHQWQLWWAGNWLGSLAIVPVALTWTIRWHRPELAVQQYNRGELVLGAVLLIGMTAWIFSGPPADMTSLLQLPSMLLALLVVAAFRLPPRWSVTLAAAVVLLAAHLSSKDLGPFAVDPNPFARLASLQIFLAALLVFTFMLSTVLLEQRRTVNQLTLSKERYRQFVAHSSEAVWRVELSEPMPLTLTTTRQIAWLKQHARIAECNVTYRKMHEAHVSDGSNVDIWREEVPWSAVYLEHLESAARNGFSMDGLRYTLQNGSVAEVYLASFSAVLEQGHLVRIWGVARNITQLAQLNERLQREHGRLQAYARQLIGAEERARRNLAVGLHEGIERQLAELHLTIDAIALEAPAGLRRLLDGMRTTLGGVQERTRKLIADVSPPGLYEIGLAAALQWLAVFMRGREGLQIDLHIDVDERALTLETRVLAFELIRELLRNVAQHARVNAARVLATGSDRDLVIEVSDLGVGFDWQYDLFTAPTRGFGLYSVADRVRSVNGSITVDTAPGKGCRVTLHVPLNASLAEAPAARSVG